MVNSSILHFLSLNVLLAPDASETIHQPHSLTAICPSTSTPLPLAPFLPLLPLALSPYALVLADCPGYALHCFENTVGLGGREGGEARLWRDGALIGKQAASQAGRQVLGTEEMEGTRWRERSERRGEERRGEKRRGGEYNRGVA